MKRCISFGKGTLPRQADFKKCGGLLTSHRKLTTKSGLRLLARSEKTGLAERRSSCCKGRQTNEAVDESDFLTISNINCRLVDIYQQRASFCCEPDTQHLASARRSFTRLRKCANFEPNQSAASLWRGTHIAADTASVRMVGRQFPVKIGRVVDETSSDLPISPCHCRPSASCVNSRANLHFPKFWSKFQMVCRKIAEDDSILCTWMMPSAL